MTWNEFKKLATGKGWQLYRHGSRHDIYRHPDRNNVMQIGSHAIFRGKLPKIADELNIIGSKL